MQCLLLSLSLLSLPFAYATVTLQVGPNTGVSVPTNVAWTREDGDPTTFDLRIVQGDIDLGFAATILALDNGLSGTVPVKFPSEGQFVLKAVDFQNGDQVIAASSPVKVSADALTITPLPTPSSTTTTTTTTTTTETTTSPCTTSSVAGSTQTPSSASSKSTLNVPAIVGGVLGGVIFLLLLAILYVLWARRREKAKTNRRLTFHRDLMVQHRPPIAPDIEHGRGIGTSPILPPLGFQQPLALPTPQGPIRSQFPAFISHTPVPEHPPTHRQVQLGSRIVQIEQRMAGIRRQNRGQSGMGPVLEHMKKQVEWLRAERDSPWARCETDVPHPLLEYYME